MQAMRGEIVIAPPQPLVPVEKKPPTRRQATVKKSLEEDYDGFVNMLVQDYAARTLERLKADAEFRIQAETVFAAQSGSNA